MDQIERDEIRRQAEIENKIETAKIFAKKGCKECNGKGYYLLDMINKLNRVLCIIILYESIS